MKCHKCNKVLDHVEIMAECFDEDGNRICVSYELES
jgi:hypothetical protein